MNFSNLIKNVINTNHVKLSTHFIKFEHKLNKLQFKTAYLI